MKRDVQELGRPDALHVTSVLLHGKTCQQQRRMSDGDRESDQLIVLRVWENHAHGEVVDAIRSR
jgi:hypothetical protein